MISTQLTTSTVIYNVLVNSPLTCYIPLCFDQITHKCASLTREKNKRCDQEYVTTMYHQQ